MRVLWSVGRQQEAAGRRTWGLWERRNHQEGTNNTCECCCGVLGENKRQLEENKGVLGENAARRNHT